jgi:ABC-type transport system involved in multi-copper enzyme maturation permease subunit
VIGAIRAEWIKITRRPATWILTLVMVSIVIGLSYLFFYLVLRFTPSGPTFPETLRGALKRLLYPRFFVQTVLNDFTGLGGTMILILGALSIGSEYGWGTLKTMLTQRPGRLSVMGAKLAVLFAVLLGYTVLLMAAGAASSTVLALLDGADISWPPLSDVAKAMAAGVLMLSVWAGLGAALAAVIRSNALPIGIGLVYMLVVEGIIGGTLARVEVVRTIMKGLPGANANALIQSFGTVAVPGTPPPNPIAGPTQAALVLAAYVVLFVVVTLAVVRVRDVT